MFSEMRSGDWSIRTIPATLSFPRLTAHCPPPSLSTPSSPQDTPQGRQRQHTTMSRLSSLLPSRSFLFPRPKWSAPTRRWNSSSSKNTQETMQKAQEKAQEAVAAAQKGLAKALEAAKKASGGVGERAGTMLGCELGVLRTTGRKEIAHSPFSLYPHPNPKLQPRKPKKKIHRLPRTPHLQPASRARAAEAGVRR